MLFRQSFYHKGRSSRALTRLTVGTYEDRDADHFKVTCRKFCRKGESESVAQSECRATESTSQTGCRALTFDYVAYLDSVER
jgi:hypothetical protein